MNQPKPSKKEWDMFDHMQFKVKDLPATRRFYTVALAPLGFGPPYEGDGVIGFGPKGAIALWLRQGNAGGPVHIAFAAKDRAAVRAFNAAAMAAGGQDNGGPGLRPNYAPNYYAAFVKDPDGNNIEAVCYREE
ncbi:MAG TPA: VOC family protein [Candidatus Binataceae bacterium]|nr:VOC family protein [Candidatus Binataceae bacterium]